MDTRGEDQLAGAGAADGPRSTALLRAAAQHRMKTTLAVIGGWARTLDERWDQLEESQRRTGVSVIRRACEELEERTEQLLVEARAELLGLDQEQIRVDLAAALETAATAFAATHVVEARVAGRPLEVMADPNALQQVLEHLVENAVKYSPAGGRVLLTAGSEGDHAVVEVVDEGSGIPEDVDVFAPFERGSATEDVAGVGLGLFIVRSLVRGMGGEISASRNPGGGSTFSVRLPLAP